MAVITVVPNDKGVTTLETTEATLGLEDVKVHDAGEVDFGPTRLILATLSFIIEMSPNVPRVGARVTTVSLIEVPEVFQFVEPL